MLPKLTKKLIRIKTSYALVIDKAILSVLEIDMDTDLGITTDGQSLLMRAIRETMPKSPRFPITKRLVRLGKGSACLYIDRLFIDLMGLNPDEDEVEMITDGRGLVVQRQGADVKEAASIGDAIDEVLARRVAFMPNTPPDLSDVRYVNRAFYKLVRTVREKHGEVRAKHLTPDDRERLRELMRLAKALPEERREPVIGRIEDLLADRLTLRTDEAGVEA